MRITILLAAPGASVTGHPTLERIAVLMLVVPA